MSRIATCFEYLKAENKKGLIGFIVAGYPQLEHTLPLMRAMVDAGVDVIELGVPFSDPIADGAVIQRASELALANGMSLRKIFTMVAEFRKENQQTPIVLMGYVNPIEAIGYEGFAKLAAEAGVDGALVVDMPPEEAEPLKVSMSKYKLDLIFLLAPTTNAQRQKYIIDMAGGFIYYVSLKGVTGSNKLDIASIADAVSAVKACSELPVVVGFGIKDADSAAKVAKISDAVVIGSAIIELAGQAEQDLSVLVSLISKYLTDVRFAIDQG